MTTNRGMFARCTDVLGFRPTGLCDQLANRTVAQVAEEYERLLEALGDESLRRVAVWKMDGLTNDEIAEQLECSRRTIARKLETIRIIWNTEPAP